MNITQWFLVLCVVTGIFFTLVFPPNIDVSKDYTFFWNVPKGNIDIDDLTVRLVIFVTVPGILFFIFRDKRDKKPKGEQKCCTWISAGIIIFGGAAALWLSDRHVLDVLDFLILIAILIAVVFYCLMRKKPKYQQKQ